MEKTLWKALGSTPTKPLPTSKSNAVRCSSGSGRGNSPRISSRGCSATYGGSCGMSWMLCLCRHPLTLLIVGSNEGTATYNGVRSLRQAAADLDLPLVRQPDSPVQANRTKQEFPTKAAAWKEAQRLEIQNPEPSMGDTVQSVAVRYEKERMPARRSTARVYRAFLNNHVLPRWGAISIQELRPRPVELWLRDLSL